MNSKLDIYMENRLYLCAPYFAIDEKKIYFSNRTCNALVIVDRETKNVESMVPFVGEELEAKGLHYVCHRLGNKIYFLPQGKKMLHVYDVVSGEQKAYELEGEYKGSPYAVWNFHVWQDKIYILPCGGGIGLWALDQDGQLSKESWWEVRADNMNHFIHGTIDDQRFFSVRAYTREFSITDLGKRETETYQLPDKQVHFATYDGQDFWYITLNSADIVRWNPKYGERERYFFPTWDKYGFDVMPYTWIYAAEQEIFVASGTQEELFLLDKGERILKPVLQVQDIPNTYKDAEKAPSLMHIDDKLIWTFAGVSRATVIDLKTMQKEMYQDVIPMNETVMGYFDKILIPNSPLIFERSDGWDLERFLYHCENSI